jgi:hypothetical protein
MKGIRNRRWLNFKNIEYWSLRKKKSTGKFKSFSVILSCCQLNCPPLFRIKLDKEDQARASAFQKRLDTMQSIGRRFETEGAGAQEREITDRNERRLREEIREKNAIEERKESKKKEDRDNRTHSISAENFRIMQERALKKEHALNDSAVMKARFEAEYIDSKEAEARKVEHRRLKAMELKRGLDVQIAEKKISEGDSAKNALNSREIELNKVNNYIEPSLLAFLQFYELTLLYFFSSVINL